MSLAVFEVPVPYGTLWFCSGNFSDSMVELVVCSAHNVGMDFGVLWVLGYCPPSGVCDLTQILATTSFGCI